jgi:hypothetical protein
MSEAERLTGSLAGWSLSMLPAVFPAMWDSLLEQKFARFIVSFLGLFMQSPPTSIARSYRWSCRSSMLLFSCCESYRTEPEAKATINDIGGLMTDLGFRCSIREVLDMISGGSQARWR